MCGLWDIPLAKYSKSGRASVARCSETHYPVLLIELGQFRKSLKLYTETVYGHSGLHLVAASSTKFRRAARRIEISEALVEFYFEFTSNWHWRDAMAHLAKSIFLGLTKFRIPVELFMRRGLQHHDATC